MGGRLVKGVAPARCHAFKALCLLGGLLLVVLNGVAGVSYRVPPSVLVPRQSPTASPCLRVASCEPGVSGVFHVLTSSTGRKKLAEIGPCANTKTTFFNTRFKRIRGN
jgi:hypothetical protein